MAANAWAEARRNRAANRADLPRAPGRDGVADFSGDGEDQGGGGRGGAGGDRHVRPGRGDEPPAARPVAPLGAP